MKTLTPKTINAIIGLVITILLFLFLSFTLVNQNNKIKNTITNLKKQITDLKKSTKKKQTTEKKLG